MSSQLDRIESMLRALCAHLGVQAVDRSGNGALEASDTDGHRYTGVVSRFEHGWGFIECEAMNRNFFVHYSDIEGTGMRSLEAGEAVSFELAPGKDGRPKAVRVRRLASARLSPRTVRALGFPRVDSGLSVPARESSTDGVAALVGRDGDGGGPTLDLGRGLPVDKDDAEASPEAESLPASDSRIGRT